MTEKLELSLNRFIQKAGENWKEKLLNCIHDEEEDGKVEESLEQEFEELCDHLKEALMQEDTKALQVIKNHFSGELTVFNSLEKYVKDNLFAFYFTAVLREKSNQSTEDTIKIIDFIYQDFIIRNNPDFFDQYKQLGFTDKESLQKTVFVLDSITEFVIEKNYTQAAIAEALEDLTRLNKSICVYVAQKIDDNFQSLQIKVLLQKLNKIDI